MPLAFAPLLQPDPFRFAATPPLPAALSPPVSVERVLGFGSACTGVFDSRAPASERLSPSVLVKLRRGLLELSAWGFLLGSGALRALSPSFLVKRVAQAFVRCAPVIDQRVVGQCRPGNGSAKRVLGSGRVVAGEIRQARQTVLVKSFSSPCCVPLPWLSNPGARSALNGSGVRRA